METNDLKPCPFCGGRGKVSFKDHRFIRQTYDGDKYVSYRVQVICTRCRSRGKPVITGPLLNPNPYNSVYWKPVLGEMTQKIKYHTEMFKPFVDEAAAAWNERRRYEDA